MEAGEAFRRIFWRHRWLLLILVLVPAAAVVARQASHPVTYAATATVQGQGITPDTTTQVSAIQSRVTAVATDPAVVQQAITATGVPRDATQVARHEISVTPLGSSAVMALTVTDRSRPVALQLSGALAKAVVNQINELGIQENPQLSALNKSIVQLTAKRDNLIAELDARTAAGAPSTSVQTQSLLSQLSATEQELATTDATSQQILTTLTANTGASVVSTPSFATQASRYVVAYGSLAALLGLVVGLLFGALREIVRPTVAQPAAGARELGTVPLGNAHLNRDRAVIDDDLAGRLGLAAHRAGAETIVLTGPVPRARLAALAESLNGDLAAAQPARPGMSERWWRAQVPVQDFSPAQPSGDVSSQRALAWQGDGPRYPADIANDNDASVNAAHQAGNHDNLPRLTVSPLSDIRLGDRQLDAALVVVLPEYAPHSSLDQAGDLSLATDWPILGVIGLRHRNWYAAKAAVAPRPPRAQAGAHRAAGDLTGMERRDD